MAIRREEIDLYRENEAVFMYFSKSAHKEAGKGASEYLSPTCQGNFAVLDAIPHWRQMLSNFSKREDNKPLFELDGRKWSCVEAYFHAEKYRPWAPHLYEKFSLDSNSDLSKAPGEKLKSAGRRELHLNHDQLRDWDQRRREVLLKAYRAKFSQNEDYKKVLLATYPAKLTHRPSRSKTVIVETELMEVRRELLLEERAKKSSEDDEMKTVNKSKRDSGGEEERPIKKAKIDNTT